MSKWDEFYTVGAIHENPSTEVTRLVPRLKSEGVVEVLDVGCGTGRHSRYLAEQGFNVHAVDISEKAIQIAKSNKNRQKIDYHVGDLTNLPYYDLSMDFVLANHSIEYGNDEDVADAIDEIDRVLIIGRPVLLRVLSTQHDFYKAKPEDIFGFSHVGFCIENNLLVHFFSEEELREFFKDYKIERLEHFDKGVNHKKLSVPLREWVMLAYK